MYNEYYYQVCAYKISWTEADAYWVWFKNTDIDIACDLLNYWCVLPFKSGSKYIYNVTCFR